MHSISFRSYYYAAENFKRLLQLVRSGYGRYGIVTSLTGIKIDQLAALDSRGYNRSRISSRAVEAYLIQASKVDLSQMIVLTIIPDY